MQKDKNILNYYKKSKVFKITDIVVFAIILLSIILVIYFSVSKTQGNKVLVYEDGKLTHTLLLSEDQEIVLEGKLTIVISKMSVHVHDSMCPDKLCEMHTISKGGSEIICLPNKVVIKIIAKDKEIDVIS